MTPLDPMKIELTGGPMGHRCKFLVDGTDISHHVKSVVINADAGDLVKVTVEMINVEVNAELDAFVCGVIVPLVPPGDPDPTPGVKP